MAERSDADGQWGTGAHPLLAASVALHSTLDDAHAAWSAGSDPAWLPPADQAVLLERLGRARQRLDALLVRTLTATGDRADGVASLDGSRSAADWLAHRLSVGPGRLVADQRLGEALAGRPVLAAALAAGEVTIEHARAVVEVLAELPASDLDASVLAEAERVMVGHCSGFTPVQVRRLGRHLLQVVAPGVADELEARRLAALERAALRRTFLRMRRTAEGTRVISGEIPELHASILDAALGAIANPRRHRPELESDRSDASAEGAESVGESGDNGQRLTAPQRAGRALCELVERLPVDRLPVHGRTPVTVTVTVREEDLRRESAESGIGLLDTGVELSPGELRRLACGHGVLPVVLGGVSEVLDLGRASRFFSGHQVTAMKVAHPECQASGCTIPASHCDAHHRRAWSTGGPTDLGHGALLCPHHHRRAHDARYETTWAGDGAATFHRRC